MKIMIKTKNGSNYLIESTGNQSTIIGRAIPNGGIIKRLKQPLKIGCIIDIDYYEYNIMMELSEEISCLQSSLIVELVVKL